MWYSLAAKVKKYIYNEEEKTLAEHLEDIFPYANSVDIYYLKSNVQKLAMNDEDVIRILRKADYGDIFPTYQKRCR